jgi:nitrite reductase/ring-hydroxylating ferredoxin subunit
MVRLCALAELPDPGTRELEWGKGEWPAALFVVRRGAMVRGYLNRCPHLGHELNLNKDEFLTLDRQRILCRSHGAQFELEDGLCVAGPCLGAHLKRFAVAIAGGDVVASEAELARIAAAAER